MVLRTLSWLVLLTSFGPSQPLPRGPNIAQPPTPIVGLADAARRREVAERFAPTFFQETLDPVRDFIAPFDFDGDWDGANNPAHVGAFPLHAVVYYTVLETATHWFVHYLPYHPVDYKRVGGHPHDTESVLLVVRKDGAAGRLEVMETRFHRVWYQYAAPGSGVTSVHSADDVDGPVHFDASGHPEVYAQRAGHGLCGGFAPLSVIRELELVCDHRAEPHIAQQGVVYRYAGRADVPAAGQEGVQQRGYALAEMRSSLWAHLGDARTFSGRMAYAGARCGAAGWRCPGPIGWLFAAARHASAEAPWGQTPGQGGRAKGDQFFDPAYTIDRRLHLPRPFALDYAFNPYLGIDEGGDVPVPPRSAEPSEPPPTARGPRALRSAVSDGVSRRRRGDRS